MLSTQISYTQAVKGVTIMAKRKKSKPTDPVQIARERYERERKLRNPENWGANRDALALPANQDVTVVAEIARKRTERITRYDVFSLLHGRGTIEAIHLTAIRRYQTDLAKAHGAAGPSDGRAGPSTFEEGIRASQIDAGARVAAILAQMGDYSRKLCVALSEPEIVHGVRINNWRGIVQRITGEFRPIPQTAAVVRMLDQLSEGYQAIDRVRKAA